jgi:hypothetical protein
MASSEGRTVYPRRAESARAINGEIDPRFTYNRAMYRDDQNAMIQKADSLSREADVLRAENAAMRDQLLAVQRGAMAPPAFNLYQADVSYLSAGDRVALSHHGLTQFPAWAVALLNVFTLGLFPLIHFGMLHDRMPQAAPNDPSSGKAIGFSFIPYFNFYWVFFNSMRLCDRLNLQLRLRGQAPTAPKGLMIACSVFTVIPYLNLLIGLPIMWTIGAALLQSSVNQVAALGPLPADGIPRAADPYAQPPPELAR